MEKEGETQVAPYLLRVSRFLILSMINSENKTQLCSNVSRKDITKPEPDMVKTQVPVRQVLALQ